jgi:hypothetical protein
VIAYIYIYIYLNTYTVLCTITMMIATNVIHTNIKSFLLLFVLLLATSSLTFGDVLVQHDVAAAAAADADADGSLASVVRSSLRLLKPSKAGKGGSSPTGKASKNNKAAKKDNKAAKKNNKAAKKASKASKKTKAPAPIEEVTIDSVILAAPADLLPEDLERNLANAALAAITGGRRRNLITVTDPDTGLTVEVECVAEDCVALFVNGGAAPDGAICYVCEITLLAEGLDLVAAQALIVAEINNGDITEGTSVITIFDPPAVDATFAPTPAPTQAPTLPPTLPPTQAPTLAPTPAPTQAPTPAPTPAPTSAPTPAPTQAPTLLPTLPPTTAPSMSFYPSTSPSTTPSESSVPTS